jgi:HSP20 family protein
MALPTRVSRGTYDPFELAQREFDSLLRNVYGGGRSAGGDGGTGLAPYGVDVREDADHIYVEAELPGFRKEDVDITIENQTLTITAERSEQTGRGNGGNGGNGGQQGGQTAHAGQAQQGAPSGQSPPQGDWLLRERRYTRFQRSFTLPPTVDESSVNARLDHGVLTVTLNKREETKPRKIAVS